MLKIMFKFKIIPLLLIQSLLLGNIAVARSINPEEENLSPRICIDNTLLTNMFINRLPELIQSEQSLTLDSSLLEKLTQYALKSKQKNAGKGFWGQNLIYLLLKKRVDRIEKRGKVYKVKATPRREFLKEITKLKKLFNERKKWIKKPDLAKEYDAQINGLESLLEAVKTQGDWDDLIVLGKKLKKGLLKSGGLIREIASAFDNGKKKKSSSSGRINRKKLIKPRNVAVQDQFESIEEIQGQGEDQSEIDLDIDIFKDVSERDLPARTMQAEDYMSATVSTRKPVLEKALEKLVEIYNLAQQDLPFAIAFSFEERIDQLRQKVSAVQKGGFPTLKKELRALEAELLKVIGDNNKVLAEALLEKENSKTADVPKLDKLDKPDKLDKLDRSIDQFSSAVTLYDPQKVSLRSTDELSNELKGQIVLLEQIIDAEMHSSMELPVYNTSREQDGLIIQVNFSEALGKIEIGSEIIMELEGEYYLFRCDKILNAGSKLLLKSMDKKEVFPVNFPLDISKGKFVYMPSTHSEDLQKKTLKEIVHKISGQDKSTGVAVLDNLLRIKSAKQDITDIEQLKESIAYTDGMDMFQKAAVNMIVKTKFGLILGPFGTGKTSVLLAGAKNLILNNKKPVFIIAPQHKIADDITLKAGDYQIPVLRCGNNSSKFSPEVLSKYSRHSEAGQTEFIRRYKQLNTKDEDNGCLYVATDMGASLDLLLNQLRNSESAKFLKDLTVIVDEAALINYPELITAIYILRPEALILVGDHVQFSPYKLAARFSSQIMGLFRQNIAQKVICRYHISSFKELISMQFNKVNLLINYRNPWISVDLLQQWYKGILDLQSISKLKAEPIEEDTFVIEDTSTWEKQSFSENYQYGNSYCNKTEALWILKRIKYFLEKGNSADEITIITYYNGQIRLISDFIDADGDISSEDARILKQNIFTPISFQGGENKILLASLGRSEKVNTGAGAYSTQKTNPVFTSEPEFAKTEALLVLLSRHKGKLSVIGNSATLDALTKQRYLRMNYLYSCLFKQRDKIKVCLDMQNIELVKVETGKIIINDFILTAI